MGYTVINHLKQSLGPHSELALSPALVKTIKYLNNSAQLLLQLTTALVAEFNSERSKT